jgi:hypothetical protein
MTRRIVLFKQVRKMIDPSIRENALKLLAN